MSDGTQAPGDDWQAFLDAEAAKSARRTRLTAFLYRLMRDNLATGVVEEQVVVVEKAHEPGGEVDYSNRGLAMYASEIAERLVPSDAS